jgi:hypothetical protein
MHAMDNNNNNDDVDDDENVLGVTLTPTAR